MRVLIAFDKFKEALSATEAGRVVADALRQARPEWSLDLGALADGGDGFAAILTEAAGGSWHVEQVSGPRADQRVDAGFGLVLTERIPAAARARLDVPEGVLGVVEMAAASGLARLSPDQRDPWRTTSRGTGELLAAATRAGATGLLLGIGGSATNDLGLGALAALGWTAQTAAGDIVSELAPAGWAAIDRLIPGHRTLPPLRIACDVTNPLLGPDGATAVYGPQKGLTPPDVARLEQAVRVMAARMTASAGADASAQDQPGAGAAGGLAFGLMIGAGATLLPGFDLLSDWMDLERRIEAADLIITGEGRFDASSLQGKGPGALVSRAVAMGKSVLVLAGQVKADVIPAGVEAIAITPPQVALAQALPRTAEYLEAAVRAWATRIR
jgi:glycerate 2-kinase